MIHINATDMVNGIRISFTQDTFDMICSDISRFPVARAAAASSAVPVVLTTVTLRNYAGTCEFTLSKTIQRVLEERETASRQYQLVNDLRPYLDAEQKKYIHLVDGGLADNLGVRTALDRVTLFGDF
ncbi:MAG: hypothetical protein ACLPX5_07205 [Dissulfurispiraceae bacterium]